MNVHPQLVKRAPARVRAERRLFAILAAACAAIVLLSAPAALAAAQPPEGMPAAEAPVHAGGEASLILPDLGQSEFMGVNGRTLLMGGARRVRARAAVRAGGLPAVEGVACARVDA